MTRETFTKAGVLDVLKDCGDNDMVYMWWGPSTLFGVHIYSKEKILSLLKHCYEYNEEFSVWWNHESWLVHGISLHGKEDEHFDIDSKTWISFTSWLNKIKDMGLKRHLSDHMRKTEIFL